MDYYVSIVYDVNNPTTTESSKVKVTATFIPLVPLSVTADKLCPGVSAVINMSVNGANTATTDYYWYATSTSTTPIATGPTFSPTLATATTYFVQGIAKNSSTDCSSQLTKVDVVNHQKPVLTFNVPVAVVKGNPLNVSLIDNTPASYPATTYTYTWNWQDKPAGPATGSSASHVYQQVGHYDVALTVQDNSQPTACFFTWTFPVEVGSDLCDVTLPASGLSTLSVALSNRNGSFMLSTTTCPQTNTAFGCLTGNAMGQNQAVAASAISLLDAPPAPDPAYALSATDLAANPFLAGAGRLRPEATYTYATPVDESYTRSTERGRFQVVPFNWQVSSAYHLPAWRRGGLATRYAPDGQALEEQDILHIYSAVKLGYQSHSAPYLTVKNAQYTQVLFESFERPNSLRGEDYFNVDPAEAQADSSQAHAGRKSLKLQKGTGYEASSSTKLTLPSFDNLSGEMQLRLWLRLSLPATPNQALDKSKVVNPGTPKNLLPQIQWTPTLITPLNIVAQTGEWILLETSVDLGTPSGAIKPVFVYPGIAAMNIWVDDLRLQPLAAQMSCYVYDWATLKLLASFDDQHFGLYYQYNAEGKLVRKQVETERGLLTIQETQYNLPRP